MNNTARLQNLILLTCLLGLLFPARVVCPQNAVKRAEAGLSKPKAVEPQGAAAQDAQSPPEDRVTIEHADSFRYDPNTKTYHVAGNVVFTNKDVRLSCDKADYHEDTDTAQATGHLRVTNPDSVITGDLVDADFGKKLAVVTGNVRIVTQKKGKGDRPAPAEADKGAADKAKGDQEPEHLADYQQKKTTITCERLEYYYADDVKKMVATPRVKAIQEDKTVWADEGVYEDLTRLITLSGNVVLNTDKGDEMHCTKAVVSMDDDWVQAENMSGITLRKSKHDSPKPAAKPGQKPAEAAQPAPAAPTLAPAAPADSEKSHG